MFGFLLGLLLGFLLECLLFEDKSLLLQESFVEECWHYVPVWRSHPLSKHILVCVLWVGEKTVPFFPGLLGILSVLHGCLDNSMPRTDHLSYIQESSADFLLCESSDDVVT